MTDALRRLDVLLESIPCRNLIRVFLIRWWKVCSCIFTRCTRSRSKGLLAVIKDVSASLSLEACWLTSSLSTPSYPISGNLQLKLRLYSNCAGLFLVVECWVSQTDCHKCQSGNWYKLTRLDRSRKTGGGCIYTKSSLILKRVKDMCENSQNLL